MPNPLPLGQGTRVISGPRAIVSFNGTVVGFASGISGEETIGVDEVVVLGKLPVQEHPVLSYRAALNMSIYRTISRGGILSADSPGSLKQQNIFPRLNQILRVEGVDVTIMDDVSKKIIHLFRKVKCVSHSFNYASRQSIMENVGFVTTEHLDESEIQGILQTRRAA